MNVRQIASTLCSGSRRTRTALSVAMWGMVVSVGVITIAQLIVDGFRTTIEQKLTQVVSYAHIVDNNPIFVTTNMMELDTDQLHRINSTIAPQRVAAVVEASLVAQNRQNTIGLLAVGAADEKLREGEIRLSKTSAQLLEVGIGESVDVITFIDRPTRTTLTVADIYSSGMGEVETALAYTSIETARSLSMIDSGEVSYYRVADPTPIAPLNAVADDEGLAVKLAEDRVPHVYSWLSMIDQNMTLIFIIMAIVAIINVVTATLIAIVDNMAKIGTLRALGMRSSTVRRLFVVSMSRFVGLGAIGGLAAGLALGAVQYFTGVITLDSSSYFLSEIPISFDFLTLGLYVVGVVAIVVVSILLPVSIISKLSIASTIKYE